MNKEEKELLLVDLCARLPYNFTYCYCNAPLAEGRPVILTPVVISNLMNATDDLVLKPYLRPMSSMTEEEYEEFCKTDKLMATLLEINKLGIQGTRECHLMVAKALGERVTEQQNWLNSHHFDYRGLIKKGLALEAPKDMYDS